tara:strand:- start:15698 stop:16573 length:876 start_codon:yes stop_codon:yes gene_type:complete
MFKSIVLLFLCSCASFLETKSDLHLFYGFEKDYIQYANKSDELDVIFYTALLKNDLTYRSTRIVQANEIFRNLNLNDFKKLKNEEAYAGSILLLEVLKAFYEGDDYQEQIKKLIDTPINFHVADLNLTFQKALEEKGFWKKENYLTILGRFAKAPAPNYKVIIAALAEMKEKGKIEDSSLLGIGDNIIANAQVDIFMNYEVVDQSVGYKIKMLAFEKCNKSPCKEFKQKSKNLQAKAGLEAKKKDDVYNKLYALMESKLLTNRPEVFYEVLEKDEQFRTQYMNLVDKLWWD